MFGAFEIGEGEIGGLEVESVSARLARRPDGSDAGGFIDNDWPIKKLGDDADIDQPVGLECTSIGNKYTEIVLAETLGLERPAKLLFQPLGSDERSLGQYGQRFVHGETLGDTPILRAVSRHSELEK